MQNLSSSLCNMDVVVWNIAELIQRACILVSVSSKYNCIWRQGIFHPVTNTSECFSCMSSTSLFHSSHCILLWLINRLFRISFLIIQNINDLASKEYSGGKFHFWKWTLDIDWEWSLRRANESTVITDFLGCIQGKVFPVVYDTLWRIKLLVFSF